MLVERENEIFNVLEMLKENNIEFAVVGGYAVSALAKHRFSVDCDIVISRSSLKKTEEILEHDSFKQKIRKTGFDKIYGGEFVNFIKTANKLPVTIDLLVNGLTSRSTDATWSFDYVLKSSQQTNIIGLEKSIICKIPAKELLLAMKIHSARRTDIRDIIMLIGNPDKTKCLEHLKKGNLEKLKKQIDNILKSLSDKNLPDSLKGVFSIQGRIDKEIEDAKQFMMFILNNL